MILSKTALGRLHKGRLHLLWGSTRSGSLVNGRM